MTALWGRLKTKIEKILESKKLEAKDVDLLKVLGQWQKALNAYESVIRIGLMPDGASTHSISPTGLSSMSLGIITRN